MLIESLKKVYRQCKDEKNKEGKGDEQNTEKKHEARDSVKRLHQCLSRKV